jgi:hypothetical protein
MMAFLMFLLSTPNAFARPLLLPRLWNEASMQTMSFAIKDYEGRTPIRCDVIPELMFPTTTWLCFTACKFFRYSERKPCKRVRVTKCFLQYQVLNKKFEIFQFRKSVQGNPSSSLGSNLLRLPVIRIHTFFNPE